MLRSEEQSSNTPWIVLPSLSFSTQSNAFKLFGNATSLSAEQPQKAAQPIYSRTRKYDFLKSRTVTECERTDMLCSASKSRTKKTPATLEGGPANGGDTGGELNLLKGSAAGEGILAYLLQAVVELDFLQNQIACESPGPDGHKGRREYY